MSEQCSTMRLRGALFLPHEAAKSERSHDASCHLCDGAKHLSPEVASAGLAALVAALSMLCVCTGMFFFHKFLFFVINSSFASAQLLWILGY